MFRFFLFILSFAIIIFGIIRWVIPLFRLGKSKENTSLGKLNKTVDAEIKKDKESLDDFDKVEKSSK